MEILCICLVCSIDVTFPAHLLAWFPACCHCSPFPVFTEFFSTSQSQASSEAETIMHVWIEKAVFLGELRPSQKSLKAQLEAFSCLELVLGGTSLPTAQVIQLIVEVEGDKTHLLCY